MDKLRRPNLVAYLLFGAAMIFLFLGSFTGGEVDRLQNGFPGVNTGSLAIGYRQGEVAAQGKLPELLRLHVLANSDTKEDQQLKNQVKDVLLAYLQEKLQGATSLQEAEQLIAAEMENLERIAEAEAAARGFAYQVTGEIGIYSFPTRLYGDALYPAGDYKAVRILIGQGQGENWWCVLFPALCFVEGTGMVPEATGEAGKISGEAAATAPGEKDHTGSELQAKDQVQYKLKIVEFISDLLK